MAVTIDGCAKKTPAVDPRFESDLAVFRREASVLNSLTEHGATHAQFSEQLARASGAFDLVEKSAPPKFARHEVEFGRALKTWSLANRVWNKKTSTGETGLAHTGEDLKLLNETREWCGRTPYLPDEEIKTSIDKLVSFLLALGADEYKRAMELPPP